MHNNRAENAIDPFALGRKSWLFSGGVAGAEASDQAALIGVVI
jgi:transposase